MKVKPLNNSDTIGLFCVEGDDGEILHMCPCCGAQFKSEDAAKAMLAAIETDVWSWDLAISMQRAAT